MLWQALPFTSSQTVRCKRGKKRRKKQRLIFLRFQSPGDQFFCSASAAVTLLFWSWQLLQSGIMVRKKQSKLRLIDQRTSSGSHSTVRTLLRPGVHCFHTFFDFSCEKAPMCCRCPVPIFRRVCVCTLRGSALSAVQCASMDAEGDHSGDGADTHRAALLSRCFLLRNNGFLQRFGPLKTHSGRWLLTFISTWGGPSALFCQI